MKENSAYSNFLIPIFSLITSLLIGSLFILVASQSPLEVYIKLFSETLGSPYGLGQVLFKSTPLIFTGLAVAFSFRSGLFNIGAEGQMNIGAFASAWAGFTFLNLPWYLIIPLSIFTAFTGGAIWASIAGFLKARFGSHEVINTIMLNFIALALVSYLVNNIYNVPATVHTPEISPSAQIPRFDSVIGEFRGSPFNLVFIISISACIVAFYIIKYTPLGYEIKTLGFNPDAAKYAGMNRMKLITLSMSIGGGFAGLAGLNFVNGYKHYFELGFSEGAGYLGIAVALIARNNPLAVIPVAVFFGILEYGGLTVNTLVPKEIITVIQAVTILSVITITGLFRRFRFG